MGALGAHSNEMSERLEATAQQSSNVLASQSEALQDRLNAAIGALDDHSNEMSERLEATAHYAVGAFAEHTQALHERLNATLVETLAL